MKKIEVIIELKGKGVGNMTPQEYKYHIDNGSKIAEEALQQESVSKYITKPIKKIIYVPGRAINIIT